MSNERIATSDQTKVGEAVHVFELAGMGKAPFRFIGFSVETYQACPGAPIQPGTSCDYCGTGISLVCRIRSADGKVSKVGCDCIEKKGDAGMRRYAHKAKLDHERKQRNDRKVALTARLAGDAETRQAEMLARLDRLAESTDRYTARIGRDMAHSLRTGKQANLSKNQIDFVASLEKAEFDSRLEGET